MSCLIAFHYRSYGTFFLHKNRLHNIHRGFTHYKYYRANIPRSCFDFPNLFMQILCYFTITVVAKPNNSGEVHLDVSIEDNQGGSGHNFSSVSSSSQTAKYEGTVYNNNSSLYITIDKTSDATALLKLKLNNVDNQPATEVPSSGITVKLNAKDNAGNWTSASNKKEVTVKIVSAKPTYPDKILVKNPDNIKDTEKMPLLKN
ncbi:Uncharacterised protein [Streptococcus pneumoniae]|nr:Uncharacterised protein [Streptococcus pneumoniae]VOL03832.1 Uncharacterised protein [Streptococcus pneumoniae]